MGLLRQTVGWSIRNHYMFLAPMYFLETLRDCMILRGVMELKGLSEVITSSYVSGFLGIFSTFGVTSGTLSSLLKWNHWAFLLSAVALTFEKFYLIFTNFPRTRYKGAIGSNFNRWIEWHWLSIGLFIVAKEVLEVNPTLLTSQKGANLGRLLLSGVLFLEAVVGLVNKAFVFYKKREAMRRFQAKKDKSK